MKTNQLMIRPMGEFKVTQRTDDGFFNATELLKQWNNKHGMKKEIADYFKMNATTEFMNEIYDREYLNPETANSPVRKIKGTIYKVQRGGNERGITWMHPLLFIDFAMWINSSFKYDVLKFVYDQMIQYRKDAGDAYRNLGSAVQRIVPKNFMPVAMQRISEGINYIVFDNHETEIRNKFGEEGKQRDLYELEKKVCDLINDGFITRFDGIMDYLRKQYKIRSYPKVFQ